MVTIMWYFFLESDHLTIKIFEVGFNQREIL